MMFPERFSNLPAYAFPRLRALLDHLPAGGPTVHMTIGEPKHPFPAWVPEVITEFASGFNDYPPNDGCSELLDALTGWMKTRYDVDVDAHTRAMALNGTREGLYNVGMALFPETKNGRRPAVLIPNPFYQVYMIAAISAGAEPVFVNCTEETGFLPDFASVPADVLDRTVAAYICTPSNPQGAVAGMDYWRDLYALAEKHDFRILSDECYSEIYRGEAPLGALTAAQSLGADPERTILFNSLSKRSNLPGLRSGFVAAGPESMKRIRQLRAYAGTPLPLPLQMVSARAWSDEQHVTQNRLLYRQKYDIADEIFATVPGYAGPEGGFFLWLPVEDSEQAAVKLWTETGVRVLPGLYLGQQVNGENPGRNYIRVAMVAPKDEMAAALKVLKDCLYN